MRNQYQVGDVVLDHWTLVHLLGEGNFGRVFEATREDYGTLYKSAIKIITIPQNPSEIKSVRASGMDNRSLTDYFHSFVEEIVREFALMSRLEGTANVVNYHDHTVIEHGGGAIGWDIIIRMELLTPLLDYANNNDITQTTAIKLGMDICRALEMCQKFNIVHRDIKPENIFVSESDNFKLGDFGIARTVEKTTSSLSKKGTYTYMAPEVYRNEAYGSSVDIYSLGLVLYRMLNDNRTPFLPEYPIPITYIDQEAARAKRFNGVPLPPPKNADSVLSEIILKACAYEPKHRYSSPSQMRQELEALASPLGIVTPPTPAPVTYSEPEDSRSYGTWEEDGGTVGMFGRKRASSGRTVGIFDTASPQIETIREEPPVASSHYEIPAPVLVLPPAPPPGKNSLQSFLVIVKNLIENKIVVVSIAAVMLLFVIGVIAFFALLDNYNSTAINYVEATTISPNPNRLSGHETVAIGLHVSRDGLSLGRQEISFTLRSSDGAIIEQGSTNVLLSSGMANHQTVQLFTHYFVAGSEYTLRIYLNDSHMRTFALFGWF